MEILKSKAEFEEKVLKNTKPAVVDFFATWCGPCKAIAPFLQAESEKRSGKVDIFKIDIEEVSELAEDFGVQSIPTLLVFKGGKEVARQIGGLYKSSL